MVTVDVWGMEPLQKKMKNRQRQGIASQAGPAFFPEDARYHAKFNGLPPEETSPGSNPRNALGEFDQDFVGEKRSPGISLILWSFLQQSKKIYCIFLYI